MNFLTQTVTSLTLSLVSVGLVVAQAQASYVPTEANKGYLTEFSHGSVFQGTRSTDGETCFITPASEISLIGLEGLGLFAIDDNGCTVSL